MKKIFYNNLVYFFLMMLALNACQKMDRPAFGDYPRDANEPGGPLKFYAAFDGTTSNSQRNAVDSIRANFPSQNPLASIDGIKMKGVQGEKYKYLKYTTANDFAAAAGSFTVAFWQKKGLLRTEHIFSLPAASTYHWSAGSMFLLQEGTVAAPVVKFFIKDATAEKWFEWVNANTVSGLYDAQWHHLAFVYDAATSKMTLYKDGVAHSFVPEWTGHGAVKLEPSKITGFKIGAGPQEFTAAEATAGTADDWLKNSWTGGIDQFRMYSIALSSTEVNELFTSKK